MMDYIQFSALSEFWMRIKNGKNVQEIENPLKSIQERGNHKLHVQEITKENKWKVNATVYPLLRSILLYLQARFVKTCSPRPHPTQAPPPTRPRPSLVVCRESKVLVADPEVFRKRTHEPHGNAMKKKQKAASPTKSKYTKNCTKVYNMQNPNHLRILQLKQNITT